MADGSGLPPLDLSLHERQSDAFLSPANEILYGGAAGGGKSHLLRVLAIALAADIPGIQIYLFRRLSDDLFKNHMAGEGGFYTLLGPWFDKGKVRYDVQKNVLVFWNKARIWLCHCQYEKDVIKYQGPDIHVLLIDELTHFTHTIYRFLRGRVRLGGLKVPDKWKARLPLIMAGTNPGGVGHNWVKTSWVTPHPAMTIWQAAKEEGGMRRQFIPALLSDNPTMENDPTYMDRLLGLGTEALVQAMISGDWDIVSGGALDDVWSKNVIIPRFKVPPYWRVNRSFDWGSSKPFSVLWFAEADGTPAIVPHPTRDYSFCPPRGSLVLLHEWYGCQPGKSNVGLKMPARAIARGIREREQELYANGWVMSPIEAGPADTSIYSEVTPGQPTIAAEMEEEHVAWTPANKSPGTRKIGLDLLRSRLTEASKPVPEDRGLWIMNHNRFVIAHWPVLPRDPNNEDDVDSDAEDHDYDSGRYRVLESCTEAYSSNLPY